MKKKLPKPSSTSSSSSDEDSTGGRDVSLSGDKVDDLNRLSHTFRDIEDILDMNIRNQVTMTQISRNYLKDESFFVTWRWVLGLGE